MPHKDYEVRIHLGDPGSSLVVSDWQDSSVFSVGMGIVLICALPYKLLTASRTIMVDLAHPLPLRSGSRVMPIGLPDTRTALLLQAHYGLNY